MPILLTAPLGGVIEPELILMFSIAWSRSGSAAAGAEDSFTPSSVPCESTTGGGEGARPAESDADSRLPPWSGL